MSNLQIDPNKDPKLSPQQYEALKMLFRRVIQMTAENAGMNKTCLNCFHFEEAVETCKICNQRPPARVIVEGCPEYDFIPF